MRTERRDIGESEIVQLTSPHPTRKKPIDEKRPPLRIAQVAPLWTRIPPATYGGIELLMKLLIDELVARGHEVTLFASGDCVDARRSCTRSATLNLTEMLERGEAYMLRILRQRARWPRCCSARAEFDVIH